MKEIQNIKGIRGVEYLVYKYLSPLVPSKREKNKLVWLSLYIFEGSVFTFQFYHLQIEK